MRDVCVFHGVRGPPVMGFARRRVLVHPTRVLALYLSPLVQAAVLLGGYSLNMLDSIEGPYAGPNTRLGLATVVIWHNAAHYGQRIIYLRLNGIVPPAAGIRPRTTTITEILRRFLHLYINVQFLVVVRLRTIMNTCTFSYKLVSFARVPYAFHNLRGVDRGRHGIARPRGSPQPAWKKACRHFKTPFEPEAHPAAVFRYRRRCISNRFPQPTVDTRRHPGSPRRSQAAVSPDRSGLRKCFRPYSGARKPPWWRGFSIRAKGHRKHQDRRSLQIRGPDRFCVPLRTLQQNYQPDLWAPRYVGSEDHQKTVGDHPGIPRCPDARANRQTP